MKYAILALIASGVDHGYDLKNAFEERFGGVWPPVNVGQVYGTLQRLERDGMVESIGVEQSGRPAKRAYSLTARGEAALREWLDTPSAGARIRDDFVMKLVLAHSTGIGEPYRLIDRQRAEYLQTLRALGRLGTTGSGLTTELLVAGASLHLEADLRWLDVCEERFRLEGLQ